MAWSKAAKTIPEDLRDIPGAKDLFDWFGYWPSFHDAEVLRLHLNRMDTSLIEIETWELTDKVDDKGYFKLTKNVVVTIALEGVSECDLAGFNHQNAILGLAIKKTETGYKLDFVEAFGLSGSIDATSLAISIRPGSSLP